MPSNRTLYEAYYQDVGRRAGEALHDAMNELQISWRKNEYRARDYVAEAERLIRRAERLDRLQMMIAGRLL